MKSKRKILFILPSLCAGGAERVISFVSQNLNHNAYDVKLIVLGFKKDAVYIIDSINVQYLNKTRLLASITALFRILVEEKPYIVMSTICHVNIMMGIFTIFFPKIKFIGREASVVSKMNEFSKLNSKLSYSLIKYIYPRLSAIICQSEDMKNDFINVLGIESSKLVVINNPITNSKIIVRNSSSSNKIHFITVGRLSEEKGYLRIIEGISMIRNYDFDYTIIGAGPLTAVIKENICKFNLTEKAIIIPYTSKVLEEVSKSDFFIQGSYVEGFPNTLLESCTVGTPVIAFKAPGGTKEIVINGINGFLVNDELDFISVLNDLNKLKSINRNEVRKSVMDKFDPEKILNQYEKLFNQI